MLNYNQQQQAVILKGIAQQILQMNVPTFEQANKLFKEFDYELSLLNFTTPEEWLKINYNLEPMQILQGTKCREGWIIKSVQKPDNKGHYRTDYPVVLNIYNNGETDKVTIETLFGF